MAESKPNQEPMSIEAFRAKKAASSPANSKSTMASPSKIPTNSKSSTNASPSRPSSASTARRYVSTENLSSGRDPPPLDGRQEKVKLLREKQAEERRRKNEERRAAFEDRRRKKEENEKERWSTLKEQASQQNVPKQSSSSLKPGSGRKLPTLPNEGGAKRPGSGVEGSTRPSSLPKPLNRPSSASHARSSTVGANKSPSQSSSDNLSSSSTPKESPSTTPTSSQLRVSLGGNKSVSASSLDSSSSANRRASDGAMLQRPRSGSKPKARPTSGHSSALALDKQGSKKSSSVSHESLIPPAGKLAKAHSTSSLHKVGHSGEKVLHKVGHSGEKAHKTAEPKPKAGVTDEETAKQALAERRKKAREEAERQAALDKERQEAERLRKEEEERILAEEQAKEEARMRELAELLRKQEEERLQLASEEKERLDREEAERIAAEKILKEEEEQKAKEEEERKALEDEERRKQEEAERLERKRRVEQIMSRTRQTASPNTTEETGAATLQETKESDPSDTKRKVSEILQKVKGTSGVQHSSSSLAGDTVDEQPNENELNIAGSMDAASESTRDIQEDYTDNYVVGRISDQTEMNGSHSVPSIDSVLQSSVSQSVNSVEVSPSVSVMHVEEESNYSVTTSRTGSNGHEQETVSLHYREESSSVISKESFGVNGINGSPETVALTDGEITMAES